LSPRTRLLIMLPVLGVAAWLALFGDKKPVGQGNAAVATAVPDRAMPAERGVTTGVVAPSASNAPAVASSAPVPGRESVKLALQDNAAPNLFASPTPPAPPPSAAAASQNAPPPLPNFVVIGSMLKGGQLNVFLDKDNQTYVATPGAVLDGNRVVEVKPDHVLLLNLSTQVTQIIPIEGDK
jgi:hypothetical protein